MPPAPPRTPLRRISHGSLSALARSSNQPPGATGLEFLEPAMVELADEAATLHSNIERLNALSDALDTFNESFASYLYAMRMNAFCVEWNQVGTCLWTFRLGAYRIRSPVPFGYFWCRHLGMSHFSKLSETVCHFYLPTCAACHIHRSLLALRAAEAAKAALAAPPQPTYDATHARSDMDQDRTYISGGASGSAGVADMTYATVSIHDNDVSMQQPAPSSRGAAQQKGNSKIPAKKGLTVKEKKEKGVSIFSFFISYLPLIAIPLVEGRKSC